MLSKRGLVTRARRAHAAVLALTLSPPPRSAAAPRCGCMRASAVRGARLLRTPTERLRRRVTRPAAAARPAARRWRLQPRAAQRCVRSACRWSAERRVTRRAAAACAHPFSAMRGGDASRSLPLARMTVLLLFACSVLAPAVVVLQRSRDEAAFSTETELDTFRTSDALAAQQPARAHAARAAGVQDPPRVAYVSDGPAVAAGTRVLVFLARESGTAVELHVSGAAGPGARDVCSGATESGESLRGAAARILWTCAALGEPPDVEFLQRADGGAPLAPEPGAPTPFVALVRAERLQLRGSAAKRLTFESLDSIAADTKAHPEAFAPGVPELLPIVAKFLMPWVATAGKKAGACGPPGALPAA